MVEKKDKEIINLCKCYSSKKCYFMKDMKPIMLSQQSEDGYITIKRYLCDEDYKKLEKYRFITESNKERKKNLKRVVDVIRKKE